MQKTALITGILGQDGAYLSKLLLEKNYKVYGLVKKQANPNFENLKYLGVEGKIEYVSGDMTDEASLINVIKTVHPEEIYNMAAQSFVGDSWDQAKLTCEVNALGVVHLLDAIRFFSPRSKFYQASTSEMYGNTSKKGTITEKTPFHPRNPYAISKLFSYWLTEIFKESYGIFCVNGILFNHESPIRGKKFVTRKITSTIARIKLGLDQELKLGNLESKRDWGFAGDYVEAIWLMMQQEKPDNYIVSTGKTHSLREFIDIAFNHVGIADWEKYITIDPQFKRPVELLVVRGKNGKACRELGWKPKVTFKKLVKMMVDADMEREESALAEHIAVSQKTSRKK